MAAPPFNIVETLPGDTDAVSGFPTVERSFRDITESAMAVEHDMKTAGSTARHKFGRGSTAARDAITDWVVGSFWLNTTTSPATLQTVVSVGPVVWEDVNSNSVGHALLAAANIFTALQTVQIASGQVAMIVQSDVNDALGGPFFRLYRNRTGVAADFIGNFSLRGKDSGGVEEAYFQLFCEIVTATAGSEDSRVYLRTRRGGADTDWYLDRGCLRHSTLTQPTDNGGINAVRLFVNNFGAAGPRFIAADEKASGTNGGAATSGSYEKVTLNTERLDEIGITITSSVMSIPAGTYRCWWSVCGGVVDLFKSRLQNTSDATTIALGQNADAGASQDNKHSLGYAHFTLAATKNVELQRRVTTTNATTGAGQAVTFGDSEVYSMIEIEKVS